MITYQLKFTLLSDATFGRGDGVAGLVDVEVQHDEYGLPFLGGRALKGILRDVCNDILYSLTLQGKESDWIESAKNLFGHPGSNDLTRRCSTLEIPNCQKICVGPSK